jgi:hypothetical protein
MPAACIWLHLVCNQCLQQRGTLALAQCYYFEHMLLNSEGLRYMVMAGVIASSSVCDLCAAHSTGGYAICKHSK